jgi:hypothetical protein
VGLPCIHQSLPVTIAEKQLKGHNIPRSDVVTAAGRQQRCCLSPSYINAIMEAEQFGKNFVLPRGM